MVARRDHRPGACIFCSCDRYGAAAGGASAYGGRAAWARGTEYAGAAGISGAALRSADAALDCALARFLWRNFGRVLPAEAITASGRAGIGHGAEQCILRLARVEPRVLCHDGNIRTNDAGVVCVSWDGLRIAEIVEAHVARAPRGHGDFVRANRLAVTVVDSDLDVRVLAGGVEQADGLMAQHLRLRAVALWWNVSLCDDPFSNANGFVHGSSLVQRCLSSFQASAPAAPTAAIVAKAPNLALRRADLRRLTSASSGYISFRAAPV